MTAVALFHTWPWKWFQTCKPVSWAMLGRAAQEAGHVAALFLLPICLADGHLSEDGARAGHTPIVSTHLLSMLPSRTDKADRISILSSS